MTPLNDIADLGRSSCLSVLSSYDMPDQDLVPESSFTARHAVPPSLSVDIDLGWEADINATAPSSRHDSQSTSQMLAYPSTVAFQRRIASFRHFLPSQAPKWNNISVREMSNYLAIELEKAKPTVTLNLPSIIFPDSSLPFPVNLSLLCSLNVWDSRKKILNPPMGFTEPLVKTWLNGIAKNIFSVTNVKPKRAWSAEYATSILPADDINCKPDVILVSNIIDSPSWKNVKAVVEVTSRAKLHTEMKKTINNKTYLIFSSQHTRRFVPFLAICNQKIYFIVTDREGQTVTEIEYRQHGQYYAINFIRIVVGLMYANEETIGFDPTVILRQSGSVYKITAGGKAYAVKSTVHAVRGVVGRSTRVWFGIDPTSAEGVAIKDSWAHQARAITEEDHLDHLKGIRGVPTLVWGGTVQIHDPKDPSKTRFVDDNTAWIRDGFSDEYSFRVHRRLVLSPVGQKLSSFSSLGELVAALRDIVVAHEACCERGIIHRDISFNNILLARYDESPNKARQGMLIDFDYAATASHRAKIGQRTGTPPFMAIALLLNGASETVHYAKYDLESIMYVAFYCATMLKGPNDSWRGEDDLKAQSVPMQEWFDLRQLEASYTQMGRTKASHMVFFERTIISKMNPYFTPLFSGFRALKESLFPDSDSLTNSPIDHKTMIATFNSILHDLPEEHTVATLMKRGTKRVVPD